MMFIDNYIKETLWELLPEPIESILDSVQNNLKKSVLLLDVTPYIFDALKFSLLYYASLKMAVPINHKLSELSIVIDLARGIDVYNAEALSNAAIIAESFLMLPMLYNLCSTAAGHVISSKDYIQHMIQGSGVQTAPTRQDELTEAKSIDDTMAQIHLLGTVDNDMRDASLGAPKALQTNIAEEMVVDDFNDAL